MEKYELEILRKLEYNPNTGYLYWKEVTVETHGDRIFNKQFAGKIAGGKHFKSNYLHIQIMGRKYKAHRVAWFLYYGCWPRELDHIDHDRSNNKLKNLREVTSTENSKNRSRRSNNTSEKVGVSFYKPNGRWCAKIQDSGIQKHLGYFETKEEAIVTRESAEKRLGYHKNHGAESIYA